MHRQAALLQGITLPFDNNTLPNWKLTLHIEALCLYYCHIFVLPGYTNEGPCLYYLS